MINIFSFVLAFSMSYILCFLFFEISFNLINFEFTEFGTTVELDFSGRQNKRQLDFKRQNENDRFFM